MRINGHFNYLPTTNNKKKSSPSFRRNWVEHASWGANFVKETGKTSFKMFTFPNAKQVFVEIAEKAESNFGNIKDRIVQVLSKPELGIAGKIIAPKDSESKIYKMEAKGNGIYSINDIKTKEGTQYRYIIVNDNDEIEVVKDPYSKKQTNINGWSEIYNSDNYKWQNTDWLNGTDPRRITANRKSPLRGLENLVIEEVNIPTLSQDGTFEKAKKHIDKIAQKGIATALEIMPVENTYSLQWGYDGVDKFAINENMGSAAKLKELIDYAHGKGLNVIIDMVPNHMGPDGDYLAKTGPYEKGDGSFGAKLNYEGENSRYVRDLMVNAALWWVNEFKADGLRFDMTDQCDSNFFLKQIVSEINYHNPMVFLIAENTNCHEYKLTAYSNTEMQHEDYINMLDKYAELNGQGSLHATPNEIGFDCTWDFEFKDVAKNLMQNQDINLQEIDDFIQNLKNKPEYKNTVKYILSHDEIGNMDGTRLIQKIITQQLDLSNKVGTGSTEERGQRAAHLGQKLTELYLKCLPNISENDLNTYAKQYGLMPFNYIKKEDLERSFNIAFAKQKLGFATVFTLPGPKMYFQGDDEVETSFFKFFREFSNEKELRESYYGNIYPQDKEKGYNTLESVARKDCIIGEKTYPNNLNSKMQNFITDLSKLVKSSKALTSGEIISTYKHNEEHTHIHHLKCNNEEILVIKNYGNNNFHSNTYGYYGFPDGVWEEVLNSDSTKYGGSGYVNHYRNNISKNNQNLNLAPNSVCILKRIY
ncbi:MAG: alpha-amylase family glycosyl hydrolase [bacterium]|nr:alpha-amylase family glycosyl hydrolase [bacterium]